MTTTPAITTETTHHRALYIGFFIYILVLCSLSFLVYPVADDYSYPLKIRSIPFLEYYSSFYNIWSGRFASNLFIPVLGTLNPHIAIYQFLPVFLILGFAGGAYYFITSFFRQSRGISLFLTAAFCATYFSGYVSPAQGIYWMSGGFTYQIAFNAFIILLGSMSLLSDGASRFWLFHAATILCIAVATGCNEVTMFSTVTIMLAAAVIAVLHRNANRKTYLAYALLALVLSCIATFAPGNFARAAADSRHPSLLVWFGITSLRALGGGFEAFKWLVLSPFLIFIAAAAPFLKSRFQGNLIPAWSNRNNAILAFAVIWLCFFWDYFVSIWSSGKHPYARINNAIYTDVLLSCLAFYAVYIAPRLSGRVTALARRHHRVLCWCLAAAVLLMPNSLNIIINTFNGNFATHRAIVSDQYQKALEAGSNGSITVTASPVAPRPIFFRHLHDPDRKWILSTYKNYWELQDVQIAAPASQR